MREISLKIVWSQFLNWTWAEEYRWKKVIINVINFIKPSKIVFKSLWEGLISLRSPYYQTGYNAAKMGYSVFFFDKKKPLLLKNLTPATIFWAHYSNLAGTLTTKLLTKSDFWIFLPIFSYTSLKFKSHPNIDT